MAAPASTARTAVIRFLAAIQARDAEGAAACFTDSARYANIPHPPAVGRDAIRDLLAPILSRSSRVRWDVVSASYGTDRAWVERVDRFWIDGREYAIECNAVIEVDPGAGLISELRDYVDLGVWRERLSGVLDR